VLDTDDEAIAVGDTILLTYRGQEVAVFACESKWAPNKVAEAAACYGTASLEHPAVQMVAMERGKFYMGGAVAGLALPARVFPCASPAEVRATLPAGADVLAFQCRNPIHRAHYELFTRALVRGEGGGGGGCVGVCGPTDPKRRRPSLPPSQDADNVRPGAVCLVHPTCGPTQDDDIPGVARYHTYEVLKAEAANDRLRWAYLPYSMHMAGPREAIQHMIIRKNYGATHFIIGRDMAGCKSSLTGEDFYGAYDAQDVANAHAGELGMATVPSLNIVYTDEEGYVTADVADAKKLKVKKLSGTEFRRMLRGGEDVPEWFAFKSVVKVLREET
jgi:sulfate adenylyltransferase